jgi:threonine/homoserine/homoserine lactone efflux protein
VKSFRKILVAAALAALTPSPLFACAACYGKSDSPLASGMNAGIFTLLGVVLTVLTCAALFFVHVIRGEAKSQSDVSDPQTPDSNQNPPTDK